MGRKRYASALFVSSSITARGSARYKSGQSTNKHVRDGGIFKLATISIHCRIRARVTHNDIRHSKDMSNVSIYTHMRDVKSSHRESSWYLTTVAPFGSIQDLCRERPFIGKEIGQREST